MITKDSYLLNIEALYLLMIFIFSKMWRVRLFLVFTLVALAFQTKSQNFTDPVVYNNFLIDEQSKIISKSLEYMSFSIHSEDFNAIDKMRLQLISEIGRSITKIGRMPDFRGTSKLKRETIDVFELYRRTYQIDLLEVLGMKKKYNDSYEALEAYLAAETSVEDRLNKTVEQLGKAQEAFAKKYDLKISGKSNKDNLSSRVKEISELSTYSRNVFLEYFAVSREFNEMVDILHERKGRLLDKRRLEVLEAAKKAKQNLNRMKRFKNESEYMNQTNDIIDYFQSLCRIEFAQVARIFNKVAMSQKDADYVNKVFSDYNANIEVLVYNWNQANQFLWRDHIK